VEPIASFLSLPTTSHAQPLPNRVTPALANFVLNSSKVPKALLIASPSGPEGCPPPPNCRSVFGNIFTNIFDAHFLSIAACNGIIEISNISLVMLAMVDFHCACVNMRLESVKRIR
jgi:hypothetical protein